MKKINFQAALFVLLFLLPAMMSAQQLGHVLNQALVQLAPGTDTDQFQKELRYFNGTPTKCRIIRKVSKQMNVYLLHFDHGAVNEYEFRDHLFRHPQVQVVQVNHILTKRQTIPDDPLFDTQWHWVNTGQSGGTNDADIDMDLAWDIATGGTTANGDEIVVAVFDDGGDLDHPDLMDNNWVNPYEIPNNNTDDDNNGYVDDVYGWNFGGNNNNIDNGGHGVNVAGMIGGVGDNAVGGTGVNWDVKIMNVVRSSLNEADVIEFYSYALDMRQRYNSTNGVDGAFVVATNSSWGIDFGDPNSAPLWCAFYDSLGQEGILNCGATANLNIDIDVEGDLPTACPSEFMVSVTATDHNDERTFSAYGATTVDVGAPGDDIYTTSSGGGYTFTSGTSFASPTTAGVIALLYSAPCGNIANLALSDPMLAAQEVMGYLYAGAESVGNLPGDVVYGRINAYNSIQLLMENCGPCPAPAGLEITGLIDVEGSLSWSNPGDAVSNNLRYRQVGAPDWIEVDNATAPYLLTGLTACTAYEAQVMAACTDTLSDWSAVFVFESDGCCVAPDDLAVSDITTTSASLSWSSIFAAQSYDVRYREVGTATWTEVNTTNLELALTGLMDCTEYEAQIQTVCASANTGYTESLLFITFGCGACTDLTYCPSYGETFDEEWIGEVMVHTLISSTPDLPNEGYTDFTNSGPTTTLATYGTYPVSLTPSFGAQTFQEYFVIFIDYNQDGDFDIVNEMAFDAGQTVDMTVTGSITIPQDALTGLTRMRVVMRYNTIPLPCDEYNYGETEDYCITIEEGTPGCDPPGTIDANNITLNSATINWTAAPLALSYNVNYRADGVATWTEVNTANTSLDVSGLIDCTDYEYRVASVCDNGELSDFSGTNQFTTICACATPTDLDTIGVSTTEATLVWAVANNASSYDLRYRQMGLVSWTEINVGTNNFLLNGLIECTNYEYQVRTICPNNESQWSNSFIFATQCAISVDEVDNGLADLSVFPNPFSDKVTTQFTLSEKTAVTLELFSPTGQQLSQKEYQLGTGAQSIELTKLNEMSSGIYFLTLTTTKGTLVRKIVRK